MCKFNLKNRLKEIYSKFPEAEKAPVIGITPNHVCPLCHKEFDIALMEGDHITPWREGGRTTEENCQMLCRECNRRKGSR